MSDAAMADDDREIDSSENNALPGGGDAKLARPVSKLDEETQFDVLKRWWRADADHSREWRVEARDCFSFRAGEQWKPEDRAILDNQNRPHIVFNRVLAILKAVAGMEINGRHEISFIPRNTEDTAVNEIITAASKWMASTDVCDGEDEESAAFDDSATCGMGWTESRMSYEDDPNGLYIEEQVNPLEMYWDRTARKKNVYDARRKSRCRRMPFSDAAHMFPGKTRQQLDAVWADEALGDYPTRTLEERRRRDSDNSGIHPYDDTTEVTIVNMQWIEKEPYWLVADTEQNKKVALSEDEYQRYSARMKVLANEHPDLAARGLFEIHAVRMTKKVYKSAFLGSELLAPVADSPIKGQFSWACVTGELDKAKGIWFGLVRVMRDPQMWANKWLSQILHILNSTAKGGILAEEDAFADQREAEDSYAQSEVITWVENGAISGQRPKIIPKPGEGKVEGFLGLMAFAISSVKDVTGINLELLGQRDENQPGIVEQMRKQAGMTILATMFDSLRRYRKIVGRKRLFFIQNFVADGRLMRIVGPDGKAQAIPLVRDKCLGEYDVIVDETPTSPNQKEANWAIIQPLLAIFKDQLIANPAVFALLLEYSPLPSRIVDAIKGFIEQQSQDPDAQTDKNLSRELIVSEVSKNQSIAEMNNAKAGSSQATAMYDFAMAKHLLESGQNDQAKAMLELMDQQQKARTSAAQADKATADADHTKAKTAREIVGTHLDVAAAHDDAANTTTNTHAARMGVLVDHMAGTAGAVRDIAAARKDHIAASKDAVTPIPPPAPPAPQGPA